jgi:hypothetical protein
MIQGVSERCRRRRRRRYVRPETSEAEGLERIGIGSESGGSSPSSFKPSEPFRVGFSHKRGAGKASFPAAQPPRRRGIDMSDRLCDVNRKMNLRGLACAPSPTHSPSRSSTLRFSRPLLLSNRHFTPRAVARAGLIKIYISKQNSACTPPAAPCRIFRHKSQLRFRSILIYGF